MVVGVWNSINFAWNFLKFDNCYHTILGKFERDGVIYTGDAILSNVEFVNCGQRGFVENYDPRFSLAFLNIEDKGQDSSVKHCSFNFNYNAALGAFGTNYLGWHC